MRRKKAGAVGGGLQTVQEGCSCSPDHVQLATKGLARRWRWGLLLGGLAVAGICLLIRAYWGAEGARAQSNANTAASQTPAGPPDQPSSGRGAVAAGSQAPSVGSLGASNSAATAKFIFQHKPIPKIVAMVNGEEISREDLARECLWQYGKDVLESMINKQLIVQECARKKITITDEEIDVEIQRLAGRFNVPVDRWLKLLEQERNISPAQYAYDIIWPTLALRKLAGDQVQVSPEEIQQEFESQFGPMVQVRLIVCRSKEKAERVHAMATAQPDQFGQLAKQYSEDINSASAEGLIQPVRKHVGVREIEETAFRMKPGEISPVLKVADQYLILKCERHIPGRDIKEMQYILPQLEETLRDRKLRQVAQTLFRQLQEAAKVDVVYSDKSRREQMPGVAAIIQTQQGQISITLAELAEQCILRHGKEVLQGMIHRRLIEQACKKQNVTITEADLDQEIARAASLVLPPKPDGSPDVEAYLARITEQTNMTVEVFRRNTVWASAALRKLVSGSVQVTEEDIERGFQANYGPRVRCRAIVMNDLRRAQEVWEMARRRPNPEYFGELARQYSMDGVSASMGGQIPPIRRFGGRPELEEQAFALSPGEISGIFQYEGKYVILFCEGLTDPVQVSKDEVRKDLHDDIYEKKVALAMSQYFQQLKDAAHIDNYLAGTVHQPVKKTAAPAAKPIASAAKQAYSGPGPSGSVDRMPTGGPSIGSNGTSPTQVLPAGSVPAVPAGSVQPAAAQLPSLHRVPAPKQ
ncbi:MAG: peptidylprolyl isomerase [Thermoguttaceae bacterium]|nr:peptidylprolyl isomerase [Thermoguttaceae bacterium]MDW8036824.1 peptidylprolyl isomerase [Thermoguttaceae bacterium]